LPAIVISECLTWRTAKGELESRSSAGSVAKGWRIGEGGGEQEKEERKAAEAKRCGDSKQ
jgi:hypothetical protein